MSNDSGSLPRGSMLAALTGGSLAAGGPMAVVVAVLVVASVLRPPASTPPVKLDETRQSQAEGESIPDDSNAGYENSGATAALTAIRGPSVCARQRRAAGKMAVYTRRGCG